MLSRSAQGLYWMGRYLVRGQWLCHLLKLQVEALVDRPVREIYFGWSRIYGSMDRLPPHGSMEVGEDDYVLAHSYTLADDLTFERSNPDSIWSCFEQGRENARQMRHCISSEMWTRLNLAYLRLRRLTILDIWQTSPESFYAETATEIDTFLGVAESTMYRDDGWSFINLGRSVERCHLLAGLLLAQLSAETLTDSADWATLLSLCHAFESHNRRYGGEAKPANVLDLLVTDSRLPVSISRSLDGVLAELSGIGPGPVARSSDTARRLAGRLSALVLYEWPDREDREDLLRQVDDGCRELHQRLTEAYFEYPV